MRRRNIETNFDLQPKKDSEHAKREIDPRFVESIEHKYEDLVLDLEDVITAYFPEYEKEFNRPSLDRYLQSFLSSISYVEENPLELDAFLAATAVRFVDNFIDEVLWKKILGGKYGPGEFSELRHKLELYLKDSLGVARKYDPEMPDEIIKLPLLEFDLEVEPTQEKFDEVIEDLIRFKSFDLNYVESRVTGHDEYGSAYDSDVLARGLWDFSRDWTSKGISEDDFSLRRIMLENEIDPSLLIEIAKSKLDLDDRSHRDLIENLEKSLNDTLNTRTWHKERKEKFGS